MSNTAVLSWIKAAGKTIVLPVEDKPVEVVEVDEMHTYVGQKKLPLALNRGQSTRQTFYVVCVRRPFNADGLEVMGQIKDLSVGSFVTDHWRSYAEFIPPEQHRQTKAEGYNSRIRHYLARFKRKIKYYSKSEEMIEIALKLLIEKLNRKKSIIN